MKGLDAKCLHKLEFYDVCISTPQFVPLIQADASILPPIFSYGSHKLMRWIGLGGVKKWSSSLSKQVINYSCLTNMIQLQRYAIHHFATMLKSLLGLLGGQEFSLMIP